MTRRAATLEIARHTARPSRSINAGRPWHASLAEAGETVLAAPGRLFSRSCRDLNRRPVVPARADPSEPDPA